MEDQVRRYDLSYREELTLKDGARVMLRLIRPEDKALLVEGLGRMSPESRYRRFFGHRESLTPSELAYLTELDQESHLAIGAGIVEDDDRVVLGLGVARYVRYRDAPHRAEAAVAVVDEAQGRGIGRILFSRLVEAAAERGVREFEVTILADNDSMLGLLKRIFPRASPRVERGIVTVYCPLPTAPPDETPEVAPEARPEAPLYRVLALAAEGALKVIRRARAWPVPPDLTDGLADESSSEALVGDERE